MIHDLLLIDVSELERHAHTISKYCRWRPEEMADVRERALKVAEKLVKELNDG